VSHQMRLVDHSVSDLHLRAAVEDRARRLAELRRLQPPAPVHKRHRVIRPRYRIVRQPLAARDRLLPPPDDTKARRWPVRNQLWLWLVLAGSIAIGFIVRSQLPEFVQAGGPLVAVLIALFLFLIVIIIERLWTLRGAKGKESIATFAKKLQSMIQNNDLEGAI